MFFTIVSFNDLSHKTKYVINKTGETVGKSATEFIEGVSEGVDRTLECEISIAQPLQEKGIRTGKFEINSDSLGGKNNLLTLYIIFDKDFNGNISAKAFDKKNLECGRTQQKIEGKAGDAKYYDFKFDKRTHIEVKGKIAIE